MREPARKTGYAPIHRETSDILFVAWTRQDAREGLEQLAMAAEIASPTEYRVERVRVISYVKTTTATTRGQQ